MQQPNPDVARWLAFGCGVIVTVPFMLFGLGFLVSGMASGQMEMVAFGATFALVGLIAMVAVWFSTANMRETLALRAKYAGTPWLWRKDWAEGRADEAGSASMLLLVFSIVWLAISVPSFVLLLRQAPAGNFIWLFVLIFPLVGAGFLAVAVHQLLRRRKYGRSVVRLSAVPIEPGHALRGELHARINQVPPDGFRLHLKCVRRVTTSSGKSTTTREYVQWEEQRIIPSHAVPRGFDGMRLPFSFNIPANALETNMSNARDAMVWRLDVEAETPGVDYAAKFELPVFRKARGPV